MARIVVIGLGPGGPDLVTTATMELIASMERRYVRTMHHRAARVLGDAISFDDVYEGADAIDEVYPRIVDELISEAHEHGEILYAVPGSPAVAERTVELLRERAGASDISLEIHPAMSFVDLSWVRLGIDPIADGVRIVDGQRFALEAAGERGPLLVTQCDSRAVLSDIKLVLDAGIAQTLSSDATVTVLHHLGSADESVLEIPWVDLDRAVAPDHLTSVYIPVLDLPVAREMERVVELVATLRRECPWDREQTHGSLRRHLLEETYEVLEALDELAALESADADADADAAGRGDADQDERIDLAYDSLEEELGDLLFQVVFHSQLATEAGRFTLVDVADRVDNKLRGRHPHVFGANEYGDFEAETPEEVLANWEQIKKIEKGRSSVFEGIPSNLPALAYSAKILKKASGLDTPVRLSVEPAEILAATGAPADHVDDDRIGELLLSVVALARDAGIDPETALRSSAARLRERAASGEMS